MSRRAPIATLGLLAALQAGACSLFSEAPEAKPVNFFLAEPRDLDTLQRVMVLPFVAAPGVHADVTPIRDAFLAELSKIQRFECVPLPHGAEENRRIYDSLQTGRLSSEAIVELGARYQLDGVLVGTVTGYRPYKPPQLGIKVQLINVHSGSTAWAAEGLYDSADALTVEDLRHYALTFGAPEESMHDWEIHLLSPRKFAAYVAHRLVGTWRG